ncbi:hypothetical protein N0V90_004098 [Kalmusia sp. IMI 367209]|nr:hypothetical protein N0V90_004098 [Kalmusia sp. IMI 367209]
MLPQDPSVRNSIAMDSGTYSYDSNSEIQRQVYNEAEGWMPNLRGQKRFTVVDYGCGPGLNWTYGMNKLLSKADDNVEFQLMLNDGLKNDWNAVSHVVEGYRARMRKNQKGHIAMLPGSFYGQIMSPESVDIGMAWSSFHFLENQPQHVDTTSESEEEAYVRWRESVRLQGHVDMVKLLRLRANEIKPGGQLIIAMVTNAASNTPKVHYEATVQALKKCLEDGLMTPEQYNAFRAPIFEPTEDDLQQILSAVQDLWSLPKPWGRSTIPHPSWAKLQQSEKTSRDYDEFAEGIAGFILAIYSGILIKALRSGHHATEQALRKTKSADEDRFLAEFKKRFIEAILSERLRHRPVAGHWLIMRLIRKATKEEVGPRIML